MKEPNLNIAPLLRQVHGLVNHQKELEKTKGETFNVFSILKMERLETRMHSAFLGELLNPNGSHLFGSRFLSLFLRDQKTPNEFDPSTARLHLEKHIGTVNHKNKTGGRIDIYLEDKNGNSISIENKIDAGDQLTQVERYANHNREKNTVFYLTLDGTEPWEGSQGVLESGKHFHCISYEREIKDWLKRSFKEAAGVPILRESIRQYIILIDKITSTMETESEQKLIKLMLDHYEEAEYIAQNFDKVQEAMGEEVRLALVAELKKRLPDMIVEEGNDAYHVYSQIWLSETNWDSPDLFFGVESFSPTIKHCPTIFVGIFNEEGSSMPPLKSEGFLKRTVNWYNVDACEDLDGVPMHMGKMETLKHLHKTEGFKEKLVHHLADHVCAYVSKYRDLLIRTNKKRRKV